MFRSGGRALGTYVLLLKMDKKRNNENVDYIVLEAIGKAAIRSLPLTIIETVFSDYESHN